MNSIIFNLKKSDEDLFMQSKWWGNPDLPEGVDLPSLTFVCQIRCDEIAAYDKDNLLPHKGMLYFFAELDYYFGDFDAYCPQDFYWDSDDVKVMYIEDIVTPTFEEVVAVDEDNNPLALEPLAIGFSVGKDLCFGNKMLGSPYNREWEDWDEPFAGWTELLQIDSDDYEGGSLNFMDWGTLHIIIDPKDLKNKNFNHVTAVICST